MDFTIPRLLQLAVSVSPNRIAATLGDEKVTFSQCADASARLTRVLAEWGVRRCDRILYWADTSLRALDLYFATSQIGAIFVPANPSFSYIEICAVIEYLRPAFIVVDSVHQEQGAAAARNIGAKLGVFGQSQSALAGFDLEKTMTGDSVPTLIDGPRGTDPNVMFLTSGSTGRPKAVLLSHRAQWLRSASSPSYDATSGGRGTACMFPLYHMAGWLMVLQAFGRRRTVHLTKQATAEVLWTTIEQHRPQELYCIPAIWRRLLEHADGGDGSYLTQALTGTSRVEPDLVEQIRRRFPNARTGIFYGSTEVGVSLGICHEDVLTHPYSIGMPMPNVEARLVDGELQLKSDTMMSEYFGLAKETYDVLQDGWYRSGDLATVDADGFYTIVGRRREVIRSGGETVAPAEVEAAIAAMPGIQDVAVIGLPDAAWGEIVCAVIAVESEADAPSIEALRSHLSSQLASFKHPRRIQVSRSPLPRTPATGQLQRNQIKQEIMGLVAQNNVIDDT